MYKTVKKYSNATRREIALPRPWEVWWAYTLFYDSSDVKLRPVIILEAQRDMIPVIELTSHEPRTWLVWQYPLINWAQTGLKKPSTAILGAVATVPKEAFGTRIGALSYADRMNIECMLEMQSSSANRKVDKVNPV